MKIFDFKRLGLACQYSVEGLQAAFRKETACQQELVLLFVLTPVVLFMDITVVEKILLIAGLLFVLIVELLNTAIEILVNMISPEYHLLAKYAKDLGSAAVFLSLLLGGVLWVGILGNKFGLF